MPESILHINFLIRVNTTGVNTRVPKSAVAMLDHPSPSPGEIKPIQVVILGHSSIQLLITNCEYVKRGLNLLFLSAPKPGMAHDIAE